MMVELRKPCEHGRWEGHHVRATDEWCPGKTPPSVAEVIEWLVEHGNMEQAARMFALQLGDNERELPNEWPREDYYDEQVRNDMRHAVQKILAALRASDE